MKCPFRVNRPEYAGGEECDPECAWLIGDKPGGYRERYCAIAVIAEKSANRYDINAVVMNTMDGVYEQEEK